MTAYKHTQTSYPMIVATLLVLAFFAHAFMTARAEPPSYDSGTNFAVTAVMAFVVCVLASFTTLTTIVDENRLRIRFGYGIFRKGFLLNEIVSVGIVRNRWYYGWGIRVWFWPYMRIYNVSGLDAVELIMKDGKTYRIGTDAPSELESAIRQAKK